MASFLSNINTAKQKLQSQYTVHIYWQQVAPEVTLNLISVETALCWRVTFNYLVGA
jgi:hypothetical protein